MKTAMPVLIWLLFVMAALFPVGTIVADLFGYRFELISVSAVAVAIAVASVLLVVLDVVFKNTIESKPLCFLLAVIPPLSFINAAFYMLKCSRILVVACVLVSAGCCCFLAIRHGKPKALKRVAVTLFALMALPMVFFSLIALTFGNFGKDTIVQTVESPNGRRFAQVIDSDQGALGGDTLVVVHEKSRIDAVLFKIKKEPQLVYLGDWGEFKTMKIYWKDDECLIINSKEYKIE